MMQDSRPELPPELLALMKRYQQLGLLLPQNDDNLEDASCRAEVVVVLREMECVMAQIEEYIPVKQS